ncbi:MAG: TolB family protein [Niastella sp.]|uniref:TolB family protein n=1 Tax=Niastella sp. TaxID=1869183 RepID=UPI00389ABF16
MPLYCFIQAQQFGGHSPATKWNQINNDSIRVIFPEGLGLEKQAADIAASVQKLAIQTAPTIGNRLRKISIVLQPYTTISNAYVALGPWRSEFNLMPSQNPFDLGTTLWSHSLALHEFRHVQQFNNFRKGLSRAAYYLFGQDGLSLANSAAVPNWFWEGDAVYQETLKSQQGRGRLSFFFNDYRSLWRANKNYSWMKLRNGSLRDFVPDHYRLGYMQVAYGREKHGPDFWKNVTDDAVRFNGVFYPFQHAIKKYTNITYKEFRKNAINYFKAGSDSLGTDAVSDWAKQQKHFAGDDEFPQWVDANTVVLVKSSYKKIPAFYLRNLTTGTDTRLKTKAISLDNYFSYRNGRIVYAAYEADVRWAWKDYSVIRVMDVHTGRERAITHLSKYFAPDISADGKTIVAVAVQPGGAAGLHILDATTGAVLKKVPNPKQLFYSHPKFYDPQTVVAAVRTTTGENTLALVNINNGSIEELLPLSRRVVGFPSVHGDTITFTAAGHQQDDLLALVNKQLYQVQTPANKGTGNYQWSALNNKAIYTAFTAAGYHLVQESLGAESWQPVSAEAFTQATMTPFDLTGLNLDTPIGVDTTRPYPISRYHKAFNLVNFHSWRPYISDPDYTFSLIGENVLNTLQTEIYFNYNTDEKYKEVGATAVYGAWFPYLTLGVAETFDRKETDTPYRTWNELNGRLGLQFPFTFNSGRLYRQLNISGGINHHQVNYTLASKKRFTNEQFEFFDASVTFTLQSQVAKQHIYPRFGFSLLSRYRQIVNNLNGYQWLTSAALYLPGVARTHNLVITGAYQKRDTIGDYSFGSSFPISRGYPAVNQYSIPDMYKVGFNYHFPLVYPDFGIGNIVYFLRVRGNAFYDYTYLKFFRDNRYLEWRSTGGEMYFDTKWWNEYNVSFGIRYSRMLNQLRGYDPNQWEFILPVNLLGR